MSGSIFTRGFYMVYGSMVLGVDGMVLGYVVGYVLGYVVVCNVVVFFEVIY